MSAAARVELDLAALGKLKAGGVRKAVRIGINRAASPVKAAVVSHADGVKRFGFLAKSIRIRLRKYGDRFAAVIGPSRGYARNKGKYRTGKRAGQARRHVPANYAHLVERGTVRSRPKPWLRPAYEQTVGAYLRDVPVHVYRELRATLGGSGR